MNIKLRSILEKEIERQKNTLDLIASENYTSASVRKAVGSVFMHKYAEGYPGARYYEGNQNIDELEDLCRKMVLKVFGLNEKEWHANVQTLSGSTANLAVYNAILNPGDKIMSMYLPDGGHLSHGWSFTSKVSSPSRRGEGEVKKLKVKASNVKSPATNNQQPASSMVYYGGDRKISIVSKIYNIVQYKTDPKTFLFDYKFIEKLAKQEKPKLIITGGTAYPRDINYEKMRMIADSVGAYYHADVAHEAGLIAGGALSSPFEFADFVTFTTHKTLRGPRGAIALCRKEFAEQLDKSVFPGMQGGPFEHNIAGITQALFEADEPEFKDYAKQIILNAQALAQELKNLDFNIITGGTDKHLVLINLKNKGIGGKYLARALSYAGIVANMNTVPYEKGSPTNPSGLRIGTPSITTRGMKEEQMTILAELINKVTEVAKEYAEESFDEFNEQMGRNTKIKDVRREVEELCEHFPIE